MILKNILFVGRENKIEIPIDKKIYFIKELKYCKGIECYDISLYYEEGKEEMDISEIELKNHMLIFKGVEFPMDKLLFICSITDGINILSSTICVNEVDDTIFIPLSCSKTFILWDIRLSDVLYYLFLKIGTKSYIVGICENEKKCTLQYNPYIESLSYYQANITSETITEKFLLVFHFYLVASNLVKYKIKNEKLYDLSSDECSEGISPVLNTTQRIRKIIDIKDKAYFRETEIKNRVKITLTILTCGFLTISIILVLVFIYVLFFKRKLSPKFKIWFYNQEKEKEIALS